MVEAINLAKGVREWRRPLRDEMMGHISVESRSKAIGIVAGSVTDLFIASHCGSTFGCCLHDGSIRWHTAAPVPYYWPNVHEGRIYVLQLDAVVALEESSGRVLYEAHCDELRPVYRAKAGTVYRNRIAFPNESGHVAIFDIADGALVNLITYPIPLWGTAEQAGRLFVATGDGELLVFPESVWQL